MDLATLIGFLGTLGMIAGAMISAGAGVFASAEIVHSQGVALKGDELNADMLAEKWAEASNMNGGKALKTGAEHTAHIFKKLAE